MKATSKRPRLKDRRRTALLIRVLLVVVLVFAIVGGLIYAAHRPELSITTVQVAGTSAAKNDDIRAVVESDISGSYAYIIPRNTELTLPRASIRENLLATFPDLKTVTLSVSNVRILVVTIAGRSSVAEWCGKEPYTGNADCYDMDENGFLFYKSEQAQVRRYTGPLEGEPLGATFLRGDFARLNDLVDHIAQVLDGHIRSIHVAANRDVFADVAGIGELRFVKSTDPTDLLTNIKSVFDSAQFKSEGVLEYADFRFGGKALLKFKK